MSALTGNAISDSYNGLLKSTDNAAIGATEKNITDGDGNASTLSLGTASASFTGTLDLSGASVTGLPSGGVTAVSNTTVQTHSGPDSSDTIYYELTIPANTFAAGDIVRFSALAKGDFTGGGWIYDSAWINSTPGTFPGQFPLGGHASTNQMSITWNKTLYIHTSDGTGAGTSFFHDGAPVEQQDNGFAQFMDQFAAGINWTVDQYFSFSAFVDNAGSSINLAGVAVTKIN